MMVDGRHAEDALAAHLERTDLQNDGQRLNDENSAYKEEQNLLLDDYRDDAKRSSERQRTHIAHKNFGGMRVVPKKSQQSANQPAAQNRQFTDPRDELNPK